MLTLRDFLVFAEVIRAVRFTALRATSPPAGYKVLLMKQKNNMHAIKK